MTKKNQRKKPSQEKKLPVKKKNITQLESKNKPTLKELWIKALQSGKFRRGINVLCQKDPNEKGCLYCPLGVLIEVLIQKGLPIKKSKTTTVADYQTGTIHYYTYSYKNEKEAYFLPEKLAKAVGLSKEAQEEIGMFNDRVLYGSGQARFQELAKAIENNEVTLGFEKEFKKYITSSKPSKIIK